MIGWERWLFGNSARNLNLTIQTNWTCTNRDPSWRMRRIKLEYKQITLSLAGRPNLVIITHTHTISLSLSLALSPSLSHTQINNLPSWGFCHPGGPLSEKEKERQVQGPYQRTKKAVEHEGDGDTNCNMYLKRSLERLRKRTGKVENWRTNWDHPNYCYITAEGRKDNDTYI